MRKIGFTLAEVLITLGIIGVVAALTAPSLIQSAGSAQAGPKLAKAKSTVEIALENLLQQNDATRLSAVFGDAPSETTSSLTVIPEQISENIKLKHFKGDFRDYSDANGNVLTVSIVTTAIEAGLNGAIFAQIVEGSSDGMYLSPDGIMYIFGYNGTRGSGAKDIIGSLLVDINGVGKPNRFARDTFVFYLLNDGTLEPFGGSGAGGDEISKQYYWQDGEKAKCNKNGITGDALVGLNCTGSIFENNQKVIY